MPLPDLPLSTTSPQALNAWHDHARAMPAGRLPDTMNPIGAHTPYPNRVQALLVAALGWDVQALSRLLRAEPPPDPQAVTDALAWAMDARPTVLRPNLAGIQQPVMGRWTEDDLERRTVTLELLLGHGARAEGEILCNALDSHHGPAVLDRLLAAGTVNHRIPRTLGMHETTLHVAARNPDHHWALPMLVHAGADPNSVAYVRNTRITEGKPGQPLLESLTPLGEAAAGGFAAAAEVLVALGSNPLRASKLGGGLGGLARRFKQPDAVVHALEVLDERLLLARTFQDASPADAPDAPQRSRARL